MKLSELLSRSETIEIVGDVDRDIAGIAYDSRQTRNDYLFAALPGSRTDGIDYVSDAVDRGACAIVSERPVTDTQDATHVRVQDSRQALAEISAQFHGRPSTRLRTIGITGTNGKTTVAFMLRTILDRVGHRVGMVGTVRYEIGTRSIPASRTTPEAPDLQGMLADMLRADCDHAVIEVSSHALSQKRVWGIDFDTAIFTNLTHDHLDYHGSMEDYFAAKSLLFRWMHNGEARPKGVVNIDDPWGRRLLDLEDCPAEMITFGYGADAAVRAQDVELSRTGSRFDLVTPWGTAPVALNLMGKFNISNALAAAAACGSIGMDILAIADGLAACTSAPGRLEEVPIGKGYQVFVDYAHTDDALSNVLQTLRETGPARIILVVGCGGNRDKSKRPAMGRVAAKMADHSILTSDNPRKENPEDIIAQIRSGFGDSNNCEVVVDRTEAITRALELAANGDVVLIAGKGHETFQEFASITVPFDDRQVVEKAVGR